MLGTDLDDILTQVECPTCGAVISVPYGQVRIQKAAACICGTLFRLTDDTPVAILQRFADELNPVDADNE